MAEYNESQINSNETERIAQETERINNEARRNTNEAEREARESTRQSNESTRISEYNTFIVDVHNAEDERIANEEERVQAEASRVTAEQARVNAENIRAEFYNGFEADLEGLHAKDEELSEQLAHNENKINSWVSPQRCTNENCNGGCNKVKGNGSHDDYSGLQTTLNYCRDNNIGKIKLDKGVYNISKPLLVFGSKNADVKNNPTITLEGVNKKDTYIIKTTDEKMDIGDYGIDKEWNKDCVISLLSDYVYSYDGTTTDNNWGGVASNITVKNLSIDTTTSKYAGIYLPLSSHNIKLENIEVRGCKNGVISDNNLYLSEFDKLTFAAGERGLHFNTRGIKTSLSITNCYGHNQTISTYSCRGVYTTFINCCADSVTGTIFDIYYFRGTIIGSGAESPNAKTIFKFNNSKVALINCEFFKTEIEDSVNLDVANSVVTCVGGSLGYDQTEQGILSKGRGFHVYSGSKVTLINTIYDKGDKGIEVAETSQFIDTSNGFSQLMLGSFTESNYIGSDDKCNKIIFKMRDTQTTNNGKNIKWYDNIKKSDILLSEDTIISNCLGWVEVANTQESIELGTITNISGNYITINKTLTDSNYKPIAGFFISNSEGARQKIINSSSETNFQLYSAEGFNVDDTIYISKSTSNNENLYRQIPINTVVSTALRPTQNLYIGLSIFDTTLKKPIWWNGSNWIDATGTVV